MKLLFTTLASTDLHVPAIAALLVCAILTEKLVERRGELNSYRGKPRNNLPKRSCVKLKKSFISSFAHVATTGMFLILSVYDFRLCGLICRSLSLAATGVNGFNPLHN